ncbi:MAG: UvrD-helicase domain-containing protein [Hydrogenophilales bacterium]|nr:UvrD-helicase domain-containing protein [Hydrogenophilales bacterium]
MTARITVEDILTRWNSQDEGARFELLRELQSAMPGMTCDAVSDLLRELRFRYGSPLRDEVLRLVNSNDVRRKVLAHLSACEFEAADSLYEQIKSWWPRESYADKKAEAETERSKQVSLKRVREALGTFAFSDADAIYCQKCSAWWDRESYAQEVLAAHQLQEKQLAEERKRRIEAERKQTQEQVITLLKQYAFTQAEELYLAACTDWWQIDSFLIVKRQWEDHERRFVEELKQKILATLSRSEFAAAIRLFEGNPQRLWPRSEFDRLYAETKELQKIRRIQEDQKAGILKALRDYRFDEARGQYSTSCIEWWPRASFESDLNRYIEEEGRISMRLRNQVTQLFASRCYADAVAAFNSTHQISLPRAEFDLLYASFGEKHKAEDAFAEHVVSLVSDGKLSELDALFLSKTDAVELPDYDFWAIKDGVVSRVLKSYGLGLDADQTHAVACPSMRALIRARAGSGKTRTLCARASVAIRDEHLDPDHVLMVAFNKPAADEVRQRMRKDFGCPDYENARTFHSLAHQLAKPTKKLLFDEGKHPSQRAQSGFVQSLLERILNPAFKELLYQFFRKEIEEVERLGRDLAPDEYQAFRRSLEQVSLKGGRVKSAGEKYIADFLFEHDIPYTYEKIWDWGTFEQGQPYKPDFTLVANGFDFILEHWAFDPRDRSALLPDEWGVTADQYRQQIARKRMFWAEKNITLLETHGGELAGGREAFELTLKERLEDAGIRCQKLPDEEIIRRVFENNFQISRMAEQFLQFIQRAKKRCLTVDGVSQLIAERRTQDQRLHLFYQLALRVYREYESELAERGAMDFDDLLRQATDEVIRQGADARIHLGEGRFVKIGDLRWLLVDEYQDFSELFYRLLSAILQANPTIRLMAVGDDWQAINGFAGAELRFFTDFARYFPGAGEAKIATNYRSARSVVTWGNRLMNGLGPEARPKDGALTGETKVVDLGKEWIEFRSGPQYEEDRKRDAIYFGDLPEGTNPGMAARRLARAFKICIRLFLLTKTGKLLLLSRTKHAYGMELGDFRNRLVGVLAAITGEDRQILRKKIRVMTAHTAKGQEEEAVVVLDASQTSFPKVHPDNLLYEIFGVTPTEVLAEEQRLFYVAITRPAETLWILTEGDTSSLYIKKLMQPASIDRPVNATPSSVTAEPSALYKRIKERIDALPSVAQVPK